MSLTAEEIASQPRVWRQALDHIDDARRAMGTPGERILVIGCGTSAFVAHSIAALREAAGLGVTDSGYASEPRAWRNWDRVIAISRSGTTTEVIEALQKVPAGVTRVVITGVPDSPVAAIADEVLDLGFADEDSVVQTRFPTTLLLLARAVFGEDVAGLPASADAALIHRQVVDAAAFDHFVYLGTGWTYGLAEEAALKIREAAQAWSESYPLLDYRHGPLAVASDRSLVWIIGSDDTGLANDVRATGATVRVSSEDPLVELVLAQQLAVDLAGVRGLDPDTPRHLTRSIILA